MDKKPTINVDVEVGETVRITSGAFEDKLGVITELNPEKGTLKLNVEMFNRDTEVEVEFSQIEKALLIYKYNSKKSNRFWLQWEDIYPLPPQ